MLKSITLLLMVVLIGSTTNAQSLDDLLDGELNEKPTTEIISATFKSVQLINSHTTRSPVEKQLIFLISHRFGYLNSGFSDLFGLDNATVRFGFEYGISQKLALGFGRSTYNRNYDLFAKYTLLQQSTGAKEMPVSVSLLGVSNISSARWPDDGREYLFAHRMSYSAQLLISRKFSEGISLQLMPTYLHYNLVPTSTNPNDIFALGAGGRAKLSNWVAFTFEYHLPFPNDQPQKMVAPLSLGFDIETGGHVFQLFFTNTSAIYDAAFITETTDRWLDGNIRFGFNISRTF